MSASQWLAKSYKDAPMLVPLIVPMPCRFGCEDSIGLFYLSHGCACYTDRVQALCAQHAITSENTNTINGPGCLIMIAKWDIKTKIPTAKRLAEMIIEAHQRWRKTCSTLYTRISPRL